MRRKRQAIFGYALIQVWLTAILTLLWAAKGAGAKMAEETPQKFAAEDQKALADQRELDVKRFRLDALKAIRESAFQRWEKRRSYEWQLSISLWTALAAFSALVLGKNFNIQHPERIGLFVLIAGTIASAFHWWYLSRMFDATIADAAMQRWAERKIHKLAFEVDGVLLEGFKVARYTGEKDARGRPKFLYYPPLSKYGYVQVAITGLLALCAYASVLAPRAMPESTTSSPAVPHCTMEH